MATTQEDLAQLRNEFKGSMVNSDPILSKKELLGQLRQDFSTYMASGGLFEEESPDATGVNLLPPEKRKSSRELSFQAIDASMPDFVKKAYNESITGLAHQLVIGEPVFDLSGYEPSVIEDIASTVISFSMPLDLATFAIGGGMGNLAAKAGAKLISAGVKEAVVKKAVSRAAARVIQGATKSGAQLGTYSGVHSVAAQKAYQGEIEVDQTIKDALRGGALGLILGGTGIAASPLGKLGVPGKAGVLATEIGAFGTGEALLDARMPTLDDYTRATGIVLGLKVVGATTRTAKRLVGEELFKRVGIGEIDLEQAIDDLAKDKNFWKELSEKEGVKTKTVEVKPEEIEKEWKRIKEKTKNKYSKENYPDISSKERNLRAYREAKDIIGFENYVLLKKTRDKKREAYYDREEIRRKKELIINAELDKKEVVWRQKGTYKQQARYFENALKKENVKYEKTGWGIDLKGGSIYFKIANKDGEYIGTVRFGEHRQPVSGGFNIEKQTRHGESEISVDPHSLIDWRDALESILEPVKNNELDFRPIRKSNKPITSVDITSGSQGLHPIEGQLGLTKVQLNDIIKKYPGISQGKNIRKIPSKQEFKKGQKVYIQLPKHKHPKRGRVKDIVYNEKDVPVKVSVEYRGTKKEGNRRVKVVYEAVVSPEQLIIPEGTLAIREYHKAFADIPKEKRPAIKKASKEFDDILRENLLDFVDEDLINEIYGEIKTPSAKEEAIAISTILSEARESASKLLNIKELGNPVNRANALEKLKLYLESKEVDLKEIPEVVLAEVDLKPGDKVKMSKEWFTVEPSETPGNIKLVDGRTLDVDQVFDKLPIEEIKRIEPTPTEPSKEELRPARDMAQMSRKGTSVPPTEQMSTISRVEAKKPVEGSKVVDLGTISSKKIPLEMEPKKVDKPIGRQKVVDYFRKQFKIPIRVGKFRHKALGIYKVKPEVVRTQEANDLSVISHEIGHHLEKKVYGGLGNKSKLNPGKEANTELIKLGKDLYGSRKPKAGYRTEGFAEYIAYWLSTNEAGTVAPEFTKYFENTFLKENPEFSKTLIEGRKIILKWREQGAVDRVYANIDFKGKPGIGYIKDRVASGILKFNTYLADDLAPLEYVEKKIRGVKRLDPRKIDPMTSPTMIARSVAQTANSKARQMVLHGTFDFAGKQTGESLREVLKPIVGDMENFLAYSYSKRGLELLKRGKNPGISKIDAEYVVEKLESDVFKKAHKGITAFENRVIQYLVDAGGLSEEAAKVIMELNPSHIPLKRVVEKRFVGTGGKKLSNLTSPIKRIKGSGLPIVNPLESILENTTAIISIADKTRVGKALVELSEKFEGSGKWVEKIPTPIEAKMIKLSDIEKQLVDAGVDISKANMEEVLTVYSNAGIYKGRDNIVTFFKDGEHEFYEVNKDLYGTLKALDQLHLNPMLDFLFGRPARTIRIGATGLNAGFGLITNPIRDAFTFGLQTEYVKPTSLHADWAKALSERLSSGNEMNLLFKRSGADMSQFLGLDRKQLKKAVSEVLASDAKRKALNVVGHPIEAAKDLFSITESIPRLAEFRAAREKGEALYGKDSPQAQIMANLAASDVTINFRRAGIYGRYINQIIPFWNAQTQGLIKFGRFAKEHPYKAAIKGIGFVTIPTVGMWMFNKDEKWYRDSPPWMRYGFWNIPAGTNKDGSPRIVRIPRPFEWGIVYGAAPEMVLDYWYSVDPKVVNDGLKYMLEQSIPIGAEQLPPSIKIPIELWSNYDFFRERPIDPYFEAKYEEPEDRYSAYTSETAKFIGKQFVLSPRKIEFLVSASTGGLGIGVVKTGEKVFGVSKEEADVPANIPVVGRLFARTETPEKRQQRIDYEKKDEIIKIKKMIKAGKIPKAKLKYNVWNNRYPDNRIPSFDYLVDKVKNKKL